VITKLFRKDPLYIIIEAYTEIVKVSILLVLVIDLASEYIAIIMSIE